MSASGEHRRDRARGFADIQGLYESPDARSVPYLLNGILNALLAINDTLEDIRDQDE